MKKILILVSLFTALFASAQTQDTLYVWKSGALVNIQSIKSVDMDSITFKRPPVNPNGINIAGPNVTDIDGNVYQSVTNCGLTFTKQNLNVSTYSDGTPIPQVTTSAWANLTTGAWCYYNNDPANGAVYGKLYNWYAAAGIYDAASLANPALRKKLAPTGWHLPSDSEWSNLINCLDPNADGGNNNNVAGGKMKATGTIQAGTGLWQDPNTQATNASGFAGLPGASRTYDGTFSLIGNYCIWWSSSDSNTTYAWNRDLDYASTATVRATYVKENGFSIRCLRDSNTTVVPIAPSDLTGSVVSPAQINLSWTDNSTNETGFKIDRKIGSGNWVTGYGIINNADTINFSDTSVSAGITYTYRVSSFNSVGESLTYSNEITVSTTATTSLPTLATNAASSIASTTAISGGTITTDGGAAITVRGVCWNTSSNPTIALTSKTTDGTGIGAFTSNITGLSANTTYFVRAYATNSVGTAYGNQVIATTTAASVLPTITTTAVSSITQITAISGGNIFNDGGAAITAKGVCWSTNANPNIALATKTNDGAGTGVFTSSITGLTAGTTYYVRAYATNSVGTAYGNQVTITTTAPSALPTLITTAVSSITQTSSSAGGNISNDGGAAITTKGVCWSTNFNPTIALTTKTTDGTGIGAFTSNITGLVANTTYYVRAYATNSVGTAYGNQVSFTTLQNTTNIPGPNVTDVDGNVYASVTNCGLTFTKQNLNVSKYSDGTPIPQVTDPTAWVNLTTGAWCYYNNDPANEAVYGKLYNWYAAAGIYDAASLANPALRKNLAPTGWHVPSDGEWSSLINCLDPNANGGNNSSNSAGGKMKATGTLQAGTGLWVSPNTEATNESGFTGLPAGFRDSNGTILGISSTGNWWSLSESSTTKAWLRELNYSLGRAYRGDYTKKGGISVRCVRD